MFCPVTVQLFTSNSICQSIDILLLGTGVLCEEKIKSTCIIYTWRPSYIAS